MNTGLGLVVVIGAFGGAGALLAVRRALDGRRWSAIGHAALALLLIVLAAGLWPLTRQLEGFEPLIAARPVADLVFERSGPRRHRATLTYLPGGRMQVFELDGDEWSLQVRVLGWQPWTRRLGLRERYRLQRLSCRERGSAGATDARSHELGAADDTGDPWRSAHAGRRWGRLIDAREASGPWTPLIDGARFRVGFDARGLQVVPLNAAAEREALDDG